MREFNVYWKKENSDKEKITFTEAQSVVEAWNKIISIKGRVSKIVILGVQEINRGKNSLVGDFIPYSENYVEKTKDDTESNLDNQEV